MKIKRREFIRRSAIGVSSMFAGSQIVSRAESPRFDPYETVPLGRTPLKVSRFCLGTGMRGGNRESNHTRLGKEKLEALIHGAYRSEERRVGKECRSRWSPDHEKKKRKKTIYDIR